MKYCNLYYTLKVENNSEILTGLYF